VRWTIVAAALLACGASTAAHSGQQIFRSGVQTVFVDVSVLKGHMPVSDLTATNFVLTDNAAPQRIEVVTGAAIPLDVTLVANASQVGLYFGDDRTLGTSDEAQRNVRQVAAALRPDDRLGVITFASDVVETRPMTPVGSHPEQISVVNRMTTVISNRYRITEALLTALTRPVPPDRRHLVVVFTLGTGTPAVSPLEHLVPAARRADALLYAVLSPIHREFRINQPFAYYPSEDVIRNAITQAAEATGGKAYLTGDIVGAFREVLKEFRSSYVLRYTLQGVPSAGWHDIVVKVPGCPTCAIRARRGYMGQ
jgi:VWFA-related protein